MGPPVLKTAIRTLFALTSRTRAAGQATRLLEDYMALAHKLSPEDGARPAVVPPMAGVDEDMRRWSFYMILEHNAIVNRSISATVEQLARGEPLSGAAAIDPKTGVMPSPESGEEQIQGFRDSVNAHLSTVQGLGRLRGTRTSRHPVFGDFDAHQWNCMLPFHLKVHLRQAEAVVRALGPPGK